MFSDNNDDFIFDDYTPDWSPRHLMVSSNCQMIVVWRASDQYKVIDTFWTQNQARRVLRDFSNVIVTWTTTETRNLYVENGKGERFKLGNFGSNESFNRSFYPDLCPYLDDFTDHEIEDGDSSNTTNGTTAEVTLQDNSNPESCLKRAQALFSSILMKSALHFLKLILSDRMIEIVRNEYAICGPQNWNWKKAKAAILNNCTKATVLKPLEILVALQRKDKQNILVWTRAVLARITLLKNNQKLSLPDTFKIELVTRQLSKAEMLLINANSITEFDDLVQAVQNLNMEEIPDFQSKSVQNTVAKMLRQPTNSGKLKKETGSKSQESSEFFCAHHKKNSSHSTDECLVLKNKTLSDSVKSDKTTNKAKVKSEKPSDEDENTSSTDDKKTPARRQSLRLKEKAKAQQADTKQLCFGCKQPGHLVKDCPLNTDSKVVESFTMDVVHAQSPPSFAPRKAKHYDNG